MRDLYIRNGHGFIIVFSLASKQSFNDIRAIREQILRVKNLDFVPIILAANKMDVNEKEVTYEDVNSLAIEWNVPFLETSAKSSKNINTLFTEIVSQMNLQPYNETKKRRDKSCCKQYCVVL